MGQLMLKAQWMPVFFQHKSPAKHALLDGFTTEVREHREKHALFCITAVKPSNLATQASLKRRQ